MKKIAIVVTHPIQYYVPVFQLLAKQCDLMVFYTWGESGALTKYDPDFKQIVSWDLSLLEGYQYKFLTNSAKNPGSHHFNGIKNNDLITSINHFAPTAILVYGWSYSSHLTLLRYYKRKTHLWFRGDSTLLDNAKPWKKVFRYLFLKWVYQHIDKAFYVGSSNKAYFINYGVSINKLTFAPHAVDNSRFSENRELEALQLRKKLGVQTTDLIVLFAGKFEQKKDPELLLKAFLELNLAGVHLLFVGNGELAANLKTAVSKFEMLNGALSKTHFIDFQNQTEMPIVYQASDLFCLPSKGPGETWGLVVNEAMAAGKAILVSDKAGCSIDLVTNDENGYIFKSGDIEDLKIKLSELLSSPDQLKKFGQRSKAKIQSWSFENQVKTIINELKLITIEK